MKHGLVFVAACALLPMAESARAASVLLPEGTVVFGQLDEKITSNTRKFRVGFEPYGHVWKDVVVNGITLIEAGTSLNLRISRLDPRGIGGDGASIEIMAISVEAMDGTEVDLQGGYGQQTPDRYGLSRALGAVLWPASFIPGRRAVLEEGLVFDMEIPRDVYIEVPDELVPTLNLAPTGGLSAEIDYASFRQRTGRIPLEIRLCDGDWTNDVKVGRVNERKVSSVPVNVTSRIYADNCDVAQATIDVDAISKHFDKGINRFTVVVGDLETEVVLNVEM